MILQTDYTRRIWTGLTTDDWGDADLREGDVIYLMDASECWVGGEGMMYQLPDMGGGGGSPELKKLAFGDYTVTATAPTINIPVAPVGRVDVMQYLKNSVESGVNQIYSAIRQLTPPAVDDVTSYLISVSNFVVCSQYTNSGTRLWNGADSNGASMIQYAGTPSAMTSLIMKRQSSVYVIKPDTYHWELWGYDE